MNKEQQPQNRRYKYSAQNMLKLIPFGYKIQPWEIDTTINRGQEYDQKKAKDNRYQAIAHANRIIYEAGQMIVNIPKEGYFRTTVTEGEKILADIKRKREEKKAIKKRDYTLNASERMLSILGDYLDPSTTLGIQTLASQIYPGMDQERALQKASGLISKMRKEYPGSIGNTKPRGQFGDYYFIPEKYVCNISYEPTGTNETVLTLQIPERVR